MASNEYVVRTKGLVKEFRMGEEVVRALNGVDLDIRRGEYLSIMGPSGSGKSTLFNAIGGLDKPDAGSVFINDVDMAQLDARELAYLRCHTIGYIFQTFNLLTAMTALENVNLPTKFAGTATDEGIEQSIEMLRKVGLEERLHLRNQDLVPGALGADEVQALCLGPFEGASGDHLGPARSGRAAGERGLGVGGGHRGRH